MAATSLVEVHSNGGYVSVLNDSGVQRCLLNMNGQVGPGVTARSAAMLGTTEVVVELSDGRTAIFGASTGQLLRFV